MFALVTTWLLGFAAFAQPLEVVAGNDLIAWHAIDQNRLNDAELVERYQQFIAEYPTSALAEVAHGRLNSLRQVSAKPTSKSQMVPHEEQIARSHALHADRLERGFTSSTIMTLEADGSTPKPQNAPWHIAAHAGASWTGDTLSGVAGAEIRYRPVGVITRLGVAEAPYLQSGLRITAPGWGPFAELSADTRGSTALLAGGRYAVKHKVWLELSGGIERFDATLGPTFRLELVQGL